MAEKPVYTKPLSLEDLGYIPEELEELKKKHSANWKDNSVNINVEGYGQGRLVINNQLGGKVRFYPDEANKAANIQTAKNLSRANEIFNLPATLSPLLSTAVGARMLVHRRGLNRAKSLYMKVDENLNIADAKNVTPGTSTLTGTTTKGTIKPGFVTDSSGQLVSPGYDTGYRSFLQRGRNEKNYPIASKAVNLLKDVSTEISAKNGVLPEVLKDVMLARKFKQSPEFLTELATKTTSMKSIFKKHGDEIGYVNLRKMGYKGGDNFITSPKGELFKYEWKDHRWSWRSVDSKKKQTETRLFGMRPDKKSIIPIFQHHYKDLPGGRKIAERQVESYIDTNTVVYSQINKALARHNELVKKTKGYNPDDILSLEHIFDVHFYHRLKDLVKTFPGQGANEISNITAMDNPLNMRTGAENKKISIDDAFLKTIKSGKGMTDYDKTIAQFIYHDVGDKVKNFTQAQWDDFLQEVLERQGDTAQEILIDMIKIDDTVQQIKSN
jgi:hypothetical protein